MAPDDARGARALTAQRLDIGLLLHDEGGRARDARHARDVHDAQREDDVEEALPQHRHQRDGKQGRGDGAQTVADAHEDVVQRLVVAGVKPDDHAEDHGAQAHADADDHRHARAVDDAAQKVAAELIRAEEIVSARGRETVRDRLRKRVCRGEQRREDGRDRHDEDDQRAEHGEPTAEKALAVERALLLQEAVLDGSELLAGDPFQTFRGIHDRTSLHDRRTRGSISP